jgi:hypothetical protein
LFLFQVTSEFGPESVSRTSRGIPGSIDYKAIPWANFQNSGAFCFLFELEGIEGVPFSVEKDVGEGLLLLFCKTLFLFDGSPFAAGQLDHALSV